MTPFILITQPVNRPIGPGIVRPTLGLAIFWMKVHHSFCGMCLAGIKRFGTSAGIASPGLTRLH